MIPPLGFDGDGKTYRVNSDASRSLSPRSSRPIKLIFVTTQRRAALPWRSHPADARGRPPQLLAAGPAGFSQTCCRRRSTPWRACTAGVPRVHVINGTQDEGLLGEVFYNHGIGTLIHANEYDNIRPAKKKDVRAIQMLTRQAVEAEELVKRSRGARSRRLSATTSSSRSTRIPSPVWRFTSIPKRHQGELACLYVSPSHENQGIGRKLIQFVENRARELGLRELLALSTQAFTYFQSKARFVEGTPDDLPPARREQYDQSARNSKVLLKRL